MKRLAIVTVLLAVVLTFSVSNSFAGELYKFELIPASFEIPWFHPFMEVNHKIGKVKIGLNKLGGDFEYYEIKNTVNGTVYILYYGETSSRALAYWYEENFIKYEPGVTYSGLSPVKESRKLCSNKPRQAIIYDYDTKKYLGDMQTYRVECYKLHTYKKGKYGAGYNLLLVYHHHLEIPRRLVGFPTHYNRLCELLYTIKY